MAIFAIEVVRQIPLPVLYGVFLYMGICSLLSSQFFGRICMLFMEPSKYPKSAMTQEVPHWTMHKFTAVQLTMFVILYAVKEIEVIAIAFPLVIAACIPTRIYLLPKMFTEEEIELMDGEEKRADDRPESMG